MLHINRAISSTWGESSESSSRASPPCTSLVHRRYVSFQLTLFDASRTRSVPFPVLCEKSCCNSYSVGMVGRAGVEPKPMASASSLVLYLTAWVQMHHTDVFPPIACVHGHSATPSAVRPRLRCLGQEAPIATQGFSEVVHFERSLPA